MQVAGQRAKLRSAEVCVLSFRSMAPAATDSAVSGRLIGCSFGLECFRLRDCPPPRMLKGLCTCWQIRMGGRVASMLLKTRASRVSSAWLIRSSARETGENTVIAHLQELATPFLYCRVRVTSGHGLGDVANYPLSGACSYHCCTADHYFKPLQGLRRRSPR